MKKLLTIQILRAIAALLVVLDHSLTVLVGHPYKSYPLTDFAWFLGEQGVAIFFVISGLIMTINSWGEFGNKSSGLNFIFDRAKRIFPLYWIFLFLATVLTASGLWHQDKQISIYTIFFSAFLIPYFEPGGSEYVIRPILGPGWTLEYEFYFYIVFSIGLIFNKFRGFLFIFVFMISLWVIFNYCNFSNLTVVFFGNDLVLLFLAGIFIGWLYKKEFRIPNWFFLFSVVLFLFSMLFYFSLLNLNFKLSRVEKLIFWLPDIFLTAGAVLCANKNHENKILNFMGSLGDESYSLYLCHIFVVLSLMKVWAVFNYGFPWIFVLCACCLSLIFSRFVFCFLEKPVLFFLKNWKL